MAFPKEFLWGAASASAQVEGAWNIDGRTPSIWDVASDGKIKNGETPHDACDHYHRYKEDVALMRELGLKSYRFSLSWSRIIPREGEVNQKGIDFYNNLINELLANGIEPLITIYHWDMPVWVMEKGGWLSDKVIKPFAEFTKVVVDAFSDRVKYWMPMNEPQCFIMNGYMTGAHAPFKNRYLALSRLTRNCLMAFHESAEVIKKYAKITPKIGIAMATSAFIPKDESPEEIAIAEKNSFSKGSGLMSNLWWADPLLRGKPVRAFGVYYIPKKYMSKIQTKLDFIGLNTYSPFGDDWFGKDDGLTEDKKNYLGWVNDGRCIYWAIRFWSNRYGLPLMVTENGTCVTDTVSDDGRIHDERRMDYMKDYIGGVKRAVDEGYNVIGYQYWSIMDNFEWAEGYDPRFGIIHVDYKTKKRTIKDSGYLYQEIIRTNGEIL